MQGNPNGALANRPSGGLVRGSRWETEMGMRVTNYAKRIQG